MQTLLLGGPEEQASEADATHASKRPRLDPDAADLGNEDEDEDEVRFPVLFPLTTGDLFQTSRAGQ